MPKVTYNSVVLPNVFGKMAFSETYNKASFSCTFLVKGSSEANLISQCNSLESSLNARYKNLLVQFGTDETTDHTYSHSANTGLNTTPSLTKLTDRTAMAASRAYKFSLSWDLPGDQDDYRRDYSCSIETPIRGRQTMSISGVYTAGGGDTASENYLAEGVTFADSKAEDLFGADSYELVRDNYRKDQEDKIVNFSRTYQEKLAISITYNSYDIPASYNSYQFRQDYRSFSFSCEFAVPVEDAADAESALREYNKGLLVELDSNTVYDLSHSANTGFLIEPSLSKISDRAEIYNATDLRFYRFSASGKLPADSSGYNFRQEGSYSISYTGSRRKNVTFSGVYTASAAPLKTALENYENVSTGAKAWANTILTAIGGNYELVPGSENVQPEQENKTLSFSLSYRQLLERDSSANIDETNIVNASTRYNFVLQQKVGYSPTGGYEVTPKVSLTISYTCEVNSEQVQNNDIESVYRSTVRPYILSRAFDLMGLTNYSQAGRNNFIAENENIAINPHTFGFQGTITVTTPRTNNQIIELRETLANNRDLGKIYTKILDGKDHTYSVSDYGEQITRSRTITVMQLGSSPAKPRDLGGNWYLLKEDDGESVEKLGVGSLRISGMISPYLYTKTYTQKYLYIVDAVETKQAFLGAGTSAATKQSQGIGVDD